MIKKLYFNVYGKEDFDNENSFSLNFNTETKEFYAVDKIYVSGSTTPEITELTIGKLNTDGGAPTITLSAGSNISIDNNLINCTLTNLSQLTNDTGFITGYVNTTYTQGTGVTISGEQNIVAINQEWLEGFVANLGYVKVENDQVCSADETTIVMTGNRVLSVNQTWLNNVIDGKGFAAASAVTAIEEQIPTFALKSELPTIPTNVSVFTNDVGYITGYVDTTYSAGNGISIDSSNNAIAITIDTTSEGFLTVGENGLKLAGVQAAIDLAVSGLATEQFVLDKIAELDQNTEYTAGNGLTLSGNEFSLTAQIPSIQGLASLQYVDTKLEDYLRVEDYEDNNTEYTAGSGLALNGTEFSLTAAIPTKVSDLVNDLGFTTEDSFLKEATYVKAFPSGNSYIEAKADMETILVYAAKEAIGVIDPEVTTGEQLVAKYGNMFGRYLKLVFATKDNTGAETASNAIYIDVNELFDSYTGGNGISIDQDSNVISLTAAVPSKTSDLNNDKGFVTLNDLEQVKTTLLEYMNPAHVASYETIEGDINTPDKSIYIEESDTLTANTSFNGKNITVQELNYENSNTTFTATGDVTISNMDNSGTLPKATSNGQVLINTPGRVVITACDLNQNGYNCIEIGLNQAVEPPKSVLIDGITFGGNLSNNAISIYGTDDDAVITISNCTFTKVSNVLRLSNRTNKKVTINFVNCEFTEWLSGAYAGIVLCQDYTNKTSAAVVEANLFAPEKVTINIINCTHAGTKIEFSDPATVCATADANQLLYVYGDYAGAWNETKQRNMPTIIAYDPAKYPTITAV